MNYTDKQIQTAKSNYTNFVRYTTVQKQQPEIVGQVEAENRVATHNSIVDQIRNGNKEVIAEWKQFFLTEAVKADQKANESKAKKAANKSASSDILEPIKKMRKLGEFGKWLNTSGNPYRKQHFNKKYTVEAVNAFLETI